MKNFNVKYKYGHLWDVSTGKRVILKEDAQFAIIGDDTDFEYIDVKNTDLNIASTEEQIRELESLSKLEKYLKILNRGDKLFFDISLTLKTKNREKIHCVFELELLEDLFIHTKKDWKDKAPKLYECSCVVVRELTGYLEYFEQIHSFSVNNAYEKTFTHYFANHGSPTCNIYDTAYLMENGRKRYLQELRFFDKYRRNGQNEVSLFD